MYKARTKLTPLLTLFILVASVSTLPAQSKSGPELSKLNPFISKNIPKITGTVISIKNGEVIAEVNRSVRMNGVRVIRKSVEGNSVRKKQIATVGIIPTGNQLVRLRAPDETLRKIERGDRLEWSSNVLYVINKSNVPTNSILQRLTKNPNLETVRSVTGTGDLPSGSKNLYLSINQKRMVLKRIGEWGSIARKKFQTSRTRIPGPPSRAAEPTIVNFEKLTRPVNDFAWSTIQSPETVQLFVAGAKNAVGVARRANKGLENMHWSSVNGNVLDVTVLSTSSGQEKRKIPLLLVIEMEDKLYSRLYDYDIYERSLSMVWNARNVWMRKTGNTVYAQKVGLNTVFKQTAYPITLSREGWDWKDGNELPAGILSPAFERVNQYTLMLDEEGKLTLHRDNQQIASSPQTYGKSPISLTPRRSNIKKNIHPSFASWAENGRTIKMVVADNIVSGVTFIQGLQSYQSSRLFFLKFDGNRIKSKWESDRLSGYVSSLRRANSEVWATKVNPDQGKTRLIRIENLDTIR